MSISVIIFSYNFEDYILRCVQSVLDQDYSPLEIVCVDDFSTDRTFEVLTTLSVENSIIKLFHNEFKKQPYNSLNQFNLLRTALNYVSGDYIFLLDGDDWWSSKKLSSYLPAIRESVDFLFDSPVKIVKNSKRQELLLADYLSLEESILLLKKMEIPYFATGQTSSLGFHRSALDKLISEYRFDLPLIWLDVQLGRKAFYDFAMTKYHCRGMLTFRLIHDNSDSNTLKNRRKWNEFQDQFKSLFNLSYWYTPFKMISLLFLSLRKPKLFFQLLKWNCATVFNKYLKTV